MRTKRGSIKKAQALIKLEEGRRGAIQVCIEAKIQSEEYTLAGKAIEATDQLADCLTGEERYFVDASYLLNQRPTNAPTRPTAKPATFKISNNFSILSKMLASL